MAARTAPRAPGTEDTRTRLLATALRLFSEHGVEGTSLQMIADELGVTKAAVYYHFRAKDEITEAVAEPLLDTLARITEEAAAHRRRGAQIEHLLNGFVDLVVGHRVLVAVFSSDPGVARAVEKTLHHAGNFKERMLAVLTGPDPDVATLVTANVTLAGIALAGGSPELAGVDDDALREHLLITARRMLGRPRPRH
ncbi:TetR family transcriptional regulator [Amycolatopsis antarctica]|uniref:TetR family transcriptional regulator n=1 Tax=Amycolatopsis antarctica TaxID=1854586 RepID=A0A263CYU5_9PSEU|nr:TetR family transcriptional regulator [Amycolatopsis antarctica]OZM70486.1 TetR family transcriptional regulator [Amycolatopsis antarctica]